MPFTPRTQKPNGFQANRILHLQKKTCAAMAEGYIYEGKAWKTYYCKQTTLKDFVFSAVGYLFPKQISSIHAVCTYWEKISVYSFSMSAKGQPRMQSHGSMDHEAALHVLTFFVSLEMFPAVHRCIKIMCSCTKHVNTNNKFCQQLTCGDVKSQNDAQRTYLEPLSLGSMLL